MLGHVISFLCRILILLSLTLDAVKQFMASGYDMTQLNIISSLSLFWQISEVRRSSLQATTHTHKHKHTARSRPWHCYPANQWRESRRCEINLTRDTRLLWAGPLQHFLSPLVFWSDVSLMRNLLKKSPQNILILTCVQNTLDGEISI